MIGHRGEQLDRQAGVAHAVGDPLAPIGVDLPREVDAPGALGRHRTDVMEALSVGSGGDGLSRRLSSRAFGEVTERLKVRDWKSRGRVKPPRGFESHPLR